MVENPVNLLSRVAAHLIERCFKLVCSKWNKTRYFLYFIFSNSVEASDKSSTSMEPLPTLKHIIECVQAHSEHG